MFPGEDTFESDNCRLTTTIGLGVVAMGASVSSRGAVNSSVQREREREREGWKNGGRERGRGWREGHSNRSSGGMLSRERKTTNSVM